MPGSNSFSEILELCRSCLTKLIFWRFYCVWEQRKSLFERSRRWNDQETPNLAFIPCHPSQLRLKTSWDSIFPQFPTNSESNNTSTAPSLPLLPTIRKWRRKDKIYPINHNISNNNLWSKLKCFSHFINVI